jgi:drug/metabolite transporter (DMT)-like permease
MVPVLSYLSGELVAGLIWLSCGLGALGSSLVALDSAKMHGVVPAVMVATTTSTAAGAAGVAAGAAAGAAGASGASAAAGSALVNAAGVDTVMGQWLTLAACMFYALSTVRIGVYSRRFAGGELAFASQATFAVLALLWLGREIMAAPQGVAWQMQHIALVFRNHTAVAVMLWIGLGPGAMASLLQMWGQKLVPASQAQVIFSSTPLWAGIIAQSVLQGEAMGVQGWIGSSVIILATLLAAFGDVIAPERGRSISSSGDFWQKSHSGHPASGAAGHKVADEG